MRVITGSARGRRLGELEGLETRPTTDRVKEGVFSALQFEIEERPVLDLFAGTGQLGIECLSRGAPSAVFVDRRRDAVRLVRDNLEATGLSERARVVQGDALDFLRSTGERFGLIFLDPPYASGLLEEVFQELARRDFHTLLPGGIIVAEHPADKPGPMADGLTAKTYRYGKISATLYRRIQQNEE